MTDILSPDEKRAQLRRLGVPERLIDRSLAAQRTDQTTARAPVYAATPEPVDLPQIVWPVKLLLPWSYLVSDNKRYASGTERHGGGLLLTKDYRRAKALIRDRIRDTLGHPLPEPASIPLAVEAAVWVPDNRPHDCANFSKLGHDAMETLIYTNDRWIHSTHWYRAGVDVDAPRCELTILPLAA